MVTCLDDETVLGMVEGRLAPAALAAVDDHLDGCEACRGVVTQMARTTGGATELGRGDTVGRYVIEELLGSGAMGHVYAARQPELDRLVAIKVLRTDAGAAPGVGGRDRLVREARAMARLDHPNVVGVHEVGIIEGARGDDGVYVAMELVTGRTLREWWSVERRPWREVARVFVEVARGLAAVHAAGVIHRDVKPDNIIVGDDGRARLGDFGLAHRDAPAPASPASPQSPRATALTSLDAADLASARTVAQNSTAPPSQGARHGGDELATARPPAGARRGGDELATARTVAQAPLVGSLASTAIRAATVGASAIAGTPAYMAPEVMRGEGATEASDQFGFGIACYEALAGVRPFEGDTWAALARSVEAGRVVPIRDVPAWLDAAIRRCLAVDPTRRFPSMDACADAIAERLARRRPVRWIAGAAIAAVAASGATWIAVRGSGGAAPSNEATCDLGAAEISEVWSPARRERLALPTAAGEAVDAWTRQWSGERDATCRATPTEPPLVLAARERCLAQRRTELAALLDRAARGPDPDVAAPLRVKPERAPERMNRSAARLALPIVANAAGGASEPVDRTSNAAGAVNPISGSASSSVVSVATPQDRTSVSGAAGDALFPAPGGDLADRLVAALAALPPGECRTAIAGAADPLPLDPDRAQVARGVQASLPEIRAALALGDARPVVERTVALVERARSSQHAPTLSEALLARADAQFAAAQLDEASVTARDALAAAERGHDDQAAARAWVMRVQLATDRRDLAGADDLAHVAAASIDRAGAPRRLAAQLLRTRALVAYVRGRLAEAAQMLGEARASFAAVAGERSLDVAAVESALGSVARARGDLFAAERHHRAALELDRALRGERHLDVARDLHNVAGVLRLRKDLAAALATYNEALRIEVALRGESSVEAGLTRNSLGLVKMARADWAGAREELERAASALEKAGHGDRAFAAHNLGLVHAAVGQHDKALAAFDHAAAIYATTIGADALAPIRLHLDRARSLAAVGNASARAVATTALAAAERAQIAWIAEDARALLARLRPAATPRGPAIAIEPLPRPPGSTETGQPAKTQDPPPIKPPPDPPPQPIRDVGVYGSGLPRGN